MLPEIILWERPAVTDDVYTKIIRELSVKIGTKRGGRPIGFSWKTYVQLMHGLEYGMSPENLINAGIITRNAFYDYKKKSQTFSNEIARVSSITTQYAIFAIAASVRYIPAHFRKIERSDGTYEEVFVPEHKPNLVNARWWLTHEKSARKRFHPYIPSEDDVND